MKIEISKRDRALLMRALNTEIFRGGETHDAILRIEGDQLARRAAKRLSRDLAGMRRLREMLMAADLPEPPRQGD